MPPRILYKQTDDEDKIRYAQYKNSEGQAICEILPPDQTRKLELIELLRQSKISDLTVKWGVCWAEYIGLDGYNTHKLLTYTDFDESTPYKIVNEETDFGEPYLEMIGGNRIQRLRFHIQKGWIKKFEIKFGPQLPADYFGNYDYSMYPGGYGPHEAFFGED